MRCPKEVKKYIEHLNDYKENVDLNKFTIFHLYSVRFAYPNGYSDSKFFDLVGYNHHDMQVRHLGEHDGLVFRENIEIDIVRIFADGSTLIRFKKPVRVDIFQAIEVNLA
jgi:hypothetical protein